MKLIPLAPTLSLPEAARCFRGRFLSADNYDQFVTEPAQGVTDSSEVKFLYLPGQIPSTTCQELYDVLRSFTYSKSNRSPLRNSEGRGDLVLGFLPDKLNRRPYYTLATKQYLREYLTHILPLTNTLSAIVKERLPECWEATVQRARRNGRYLIGREYTEWPELRDRLGPRPEPFFEPIISALTVNNTISFRSHADDANAGGLTWLMAVGKFAGANLCLPRLRVAFRLQPGDLLILDGNREQHGNLAPLAGERISLVGYLKDLSGRVRNAS